MLAATGARRQERGAAGSRACSVSCAGGCAGTAGACRTRHSFVRVARCEGGGGCSAGNGSIRADAGPPVAAARCDSGFPPRARRLNSPGRAPPRRAPRGRCCELLAAACGGAARDCRPKQKPSARASVGARARGLSLHPFLLARLAAAPPRAGRRHRARGARRVYVLVLARAGA